MPDFKFDDSAPEPSKPSPPPQGGQSEESPVKPADFQFSLDDAPSPSTTPPGAAPAVPVDLPSPTIPGLTPPARPQRPAGATPPAPTGAPAKPVGPSAPVSGVPTPGASKPGAPTPGATTPGAPKPVTPPAGGAPQAAPGAPLRPATPARPAPAPVPSPAIPIPLPIPSLSAFEGEGENDQGSQDNYSRNMESFGFKIKSFLDALEEPASWVLRVALVIGIAALAYLLAGTILGKAGHLQGNPNAVALVKNLTLASKAFMYSLVAASIATMLLAYEDNRLGFMVGGIGLFFHFLSPIILQKFVGTSAATIAMAPFFRQGGYLLVMIGLVKGLGDTAIWLWNLPEKMKERHANVGVSNQAEAKQRIIAREANMMSPCWKLPFCRESIRKQCPAFLAKTTCWKFGRGCYCDEEMISRIVRGESLDVIKAPTRLSRQGKPPCGRCYIYIEHQTYKFRMVSPLALPTAVLATYLVWPVYTKFYMTANSALESVLGTLSIGAKNVNLTPEALQSSKDALEAARQVGNSPEQIAAIAQNMIGALLGFMLLIYISKFIEWAIFKAKW